MSWDGARAGVTFSRARTLKVPCLCQHSPAPRSSSIRSSAGSRASSAAWSSRSSERTTRQRSGEIDATGGGDGAPAAPLSPRARSRSSLPAAIIFVRSATSPLRTLAMRAGSALASRRRGARALEARCGGVARVRRVG